MTVAIPTRMRHLDKDARGFPIPVMVFRDKSGRAHFTINDEATRQLLMIEQKCSICGLSLLKRRWFVGGPLSAFHPHGSYLDPPLHRECAHYALQVCPYLAMPSYNKRIDAKTVTEQDPYRIYIDYTQIATRPVLFVLVGADAQSVSGAYVRPARPYKAVEYWQNGKRLTVAEGTVLVKQALLGKVE